MLPSNLSKIFHKVPSVRTSRFKIFYALLKQPKSTDEQGAYGCNIMTNTAHIVEQLTGPSCNFALKESDGNILHWMPDLFKLIFKAINDILVYCDKFYDHVTSRPTDFIHLFYRSLPVNRIYNFVNHISILVLLILMIIVIVHIKDSALDIFQL
jgi:hypothetical protein